MFQGEKDDDRNWDVEACGALVNADEMRGAVCVAARGSCFFSQKTLACQRAGAVAAIIVNTDFAEGAADNWVGSHDPSDISIPTVSLGGEEGNRLLRRMFDPDVADEPNATVDARAYARTVTARLYAYECRARARCPRCAPGFADTSNECASARCPGMDDARTRNCSGRGVGPGGGCRLVRSAEGADPSAIEPAFACACAEGYEGVACERRREDRPVAAKSAGFRPRRDGAKSARRRRSRPGDGADARGNFSRGDVRGRRGGAADWARGVRHLARTPEETTRGDAPNQSRRALVCALRTAPRGGKAGRERDEHETRAQRADETNEDAMKETE